MTFWHLSFFHSKYLLAPLGAGLSINPAPTKSWKYSWRRGLTQLQWVFSTVWQSLTTGVPHALTQVAYYCVWGPNNLSKGLLSRAAFSLSRVTTCLLVHRLRSSLEFISCSSTYILHTKHDQIPSLNKINYPNVLFLGSSLFIYLNIH